MEFTFLEAPPLGFYRVAIKRPDGDNPEGVFIQDCADLDEARRVCNATWREHGGRHPVAVIDHRWQKVFFVFRPVEIRLPPEPKKRDVRVRFLERKLEEYRQRLGDPRFAVESPDAAFKIALVDRLLRDGVVNTTGLRAELEPTHQVTMTHYCWIFENACRVIKKYIDTGGEF